MKKVLVFALVGGVFTLASCGGGSNADDEAAAQAKLDSIKAAEQAQQEADAAEAAAAAAAAGYEAGKAAAEAGAEAAEEVVEEATEETPASPSNKLKDKLNNATTDGEAAAEGEPTKGGKLKDRLKK